MSTVAALIDQIRTPVRARLVPQECPRAGERRGHGRHLYGGIDMTQRTCSINDCEQAAICRGWCTKHYQRWRKNGEPIATRRIVGDDIARFWSHVDKTENCWLWTGSHGLYGVFRIGGRDGHNIGAHRYAYELLVGPIPGGMQLDHLCRVKLCVNPDHLEVVTPRENTLRGGTIPAANAAKTHCLRGHPFDEPNTYWHRGRRYCRACRNGWYE